MNTFGPAYSEVSTGYAVTASRTDASEESSSDYDPPPGMFWSSVNFTMKLLFIACILLQALLWPSIMTIIVVVVLALETIIKLFFGNKDGYISSLTSYGVFFLRAGKPKPSLYLYSGVFTVYALGFFVLYNAQQIRDMPPMTSWIHPDYIHNYSFTESKNNDFVGMDVRSGASKYMRDNTFTWPRELKVPALRISGTLPRAGPASSSLACDSNSKYACYAANMVAQTSAPSIARAVTPMPSQFYTTDIMVKPPSGVACAKLEVYRIVYDADRTVDYGLDYPASSPPAAASNLQRATCNLFGDSQWCLLFRHPFDSTQYDATIASKCKDDGILIFRLPPRSVDVEPETGRMGLDALIITAGASVSVKYTWHVKEAQMLDNWKQWSNTKDDGVQPWRVSTEGWPVFCRYAIAITPFLMLWYYMTVNFEKMVEYSPTRQILMTCIFVLLPASLLFFVVGAWIPLAGCITCALALNHSTNLAPMRIVLMFITLACNLAQFIYVIYIINSAGISAFMYEDSLRQIQDQVSGLAFVSGSPTWISLAMPTTLALNAAFAIGVLTCIVYESYIWINRGAKTAKVYSRSDARADGYDT